MSRRHDLLVENVRKTRSGAIAVRFGCNACLSYRGDETYGRTAAEATERAARIVETHAELSQVGAVPQLRRALSRP